MKIESVCLKSKNNYFFTGGFFVPTKEIKQICINTKDTSVKISDQTTNDEGIIMYFDGESVKEGKIECEIDINEERLNIYISSDEVYNPVHTQTVILNLPIQKFDLIRIDAKDAEVSFENKTQELLANEVVIVSTDTDININKNFPATKLNVLSEKYYRPCNIQFNAKVSPEAEMLNFLSSFGDIDVIIDDVSCVKEVDDLKTLTIGSKEIKLTVNTSGKRNITLNGINKK